MERKGSFGIETNHSRVAHAWKMFAGFDVIGSDLTSETGTGERGRIGR